MSKTILTSPNKEDQMEYATEEEMIEHCDQYPCIDCPIAERCSMLENLNKWGKIRNLLPDNEWLLDDL